MFITLSLFIRKLIGGGAFKTPCILIQFITHEIAIVDVDEGRLKAEMMDLQQGASFIGGPKIEASTDYTITANSVICIITAGVRQRNEETRLDLLKRNIDVYMNIIPQLLQQSPSSVLLVASNPVDILTLLTRKISGLPSHKVIGSGTNLDTSRLRSLLAQELNLSVNNCHGWVIGEHGDTSVPVWSGVNIAGACLQDLSKPTEKDSGAEIFNLMHKQVIESAYEIIRLKGYTSWAIGLSLASICQAILRNDLSVHAVSTSLKGFYGIDDDVCLSLPCVLGRNGISHIIKLPWNEEELRQLRKSAGVISSLVKDLEI